MISEKNIKRGKCKRIPQDKDALFLRYQERWIRDRSRIKIMEKGRQIGISWASAYDIDREQAKTSTRLDAWISSRDEIQARLFLDDCKKFAAMLNIAAEDLGMQVLDDKSNTAFVLRYANGTKINSMSSSPDAQAGKRGTRLLDEFALHKDPRLLYTIALPGITWGGQLAIVSTHRGSGNFFNELIREIREKDNPKGIHLHTVTLQNALDDGFLYKLQQKLPDDDPRLEMDDADYFNYVRASCADEESFLQEFMCVPADDNSAFLTYDLIASCEYKEGEAWELPFEQIKNPIYVGVDIGRLHDLTVISVMEDCAKRLMTRRLIELKAMPFTQQEAILYDLLALPNMRRCCIDATGLGMQLAERAEEKFGKYRVEGIKFSGPVKEDLAYPLRAAFEDGNIRIPFNKFVRADLRAIRKETTAAGNIRFAADRGTNGHSDRFWAFALAKHASKAEGGPCLAAAANDGNSDEFRANDEWNSPAHDYERKTSQEWSY